MLSKSDYNSFLAVNDVKARSPVEVGIDYEESNREWYHCRLFKTYAVCV